MRLPRLQRILCQASLALAGGVCALWLFAAAPADALDRVAVRTPGADDDLRRNLRNASLLLEAEAAGVNDPQELLAAAKAEYGRMVAVLYGAGHYSGIVTVRIDGREAAEFSPIEVPRGIREIVVTVEPGPAFTFGRAEVGPLSRRTELPEDFAPGAIARSDLIRDAARAAVDGWRAVGHAKARPGEASVTADHRAAQLDAVIPIAPGPRLRFGDFIIRGNERTRPGRIRAIAGLPEGEVFDPEAVDLAAQRLRRTGTFASVALTEADDIGPGDTLDITATLIEAPLRRFGFGAELDTEDGLRLSAFWLHRNLFGGAERLRVEGEIGGIGSQTSGRDYRFAARFGRPATFTPETTLTFGFTAETVSEPDYDAVRVGVDAGVVHLFSDRLTGEAGIALLYERSEDAAGRRTRTNLALPTALIYDRRDDDRDTTRGYYLEGRVTPFLGFSGTDSGAQLRLDARGYYPVGEGTVLALRVQAGSVVGAGIADTPRAYLFYSGGGGTVRGQPYRSLGVELPCPGGPPGCTVASGGRGFAALSGEVRTQVSENIGLVGFLDTGRVSASSFLQGGDWHAGAGLGVRYRTGIGPIRVDLGGPVAGSTGNGLQLYVGIGQAF